MYAMLCESKLKKIVLSFENKIRTCLGEPPGFAAYHNFDFPVVENGKNK